MNVLNGGTGESGIPGYTSGKWAMSAREVQDYGSAILANSGVCAFHMWKWDLANPSYFQRADIQQAAALGQAAGAHAATPCRVH
jgi:hypothetical protein